ncbi:GNAT family N-acetyltransferase [Vagococcus fluvialis]|uniref:GNAT family N-acetyltransferase n=1 Tax=Vagococcus fluvialis TaxID=2738 RepID=UPI001D0B7F08|nr:GNAT family N-acetyltransferase [Vagococcus fluvialis]UDM71414.1 GNAT family N-acetyltransferase [Vagococcus fluvialis]UDM76275.1 GNAT family N-acetyltransferase [Vagococcus fluvialis]UDM83106.1 GNAT family N-acetyltransferase [Vagococcus fluvialis]
MIKKVTDKKDIEKVHELGSYAFNMDHTEEQKQAYIEKNTFIDNYVDEVDGEVLSQIVSYPFEVTIKGQVMKMSGIGDVASYPETRGSGGIRNIFSAIFNDLHENGTELSYLAPFSQPFYRKFGYEIVFDSEEIRIPKAVITQIKPEKKGKVKRVKWEDEDTKAILKEIYRDTLEKVHGSVIREDYWWHYTMIKKQKRVAICYDDNNMPQGYLIYGLVGASEFQIFEMAYRNSFALRKLMSFVSSHSGSFNEFVSTNLPDKAVLELFTEISGITRKTYSYMMVKIVNFKQFIEKYPFKKVEKEADFYVEIQDDSCEWNNGIFHLVIKNGKATCEKVTEAKKIDYSGSIQHFTQVFMGRLTLDQAVWLELIDEKTEGNNLSELIDSVTPRMYDYF